MSRRSLSQAVFPDGVTPCVVALCGGGGKTTLMYSLARELTTRGVPVICSTTTKLFPPCIPDDVQALVLAESSDFFSPSLLKKAPVLVVDHFHAASGKLIGLAPQTVDVLARAFPTAVVLVEADGAAGKPLKAPLPHEPVFPSSTALAVALIGLNALSAGRNTALPLSEATTHRLEQVCALTGLASGDPLTQGALLTLATHERGWFQHCPMQARRVVFGNKADAFAVPSSWPADAASPLEWLVGSAREGWCL